ncbi:MAG: hypothetical protein NWE89_12570 [Candidatus Bathyarchaeota archaeon]|nr:hypothetical protein [Candidatus Bathyarchaeota archaeon]
MEYEVRGGVFSKEIKVDLGKYLLIVMDIDNKKGKRVTIDLDEVIIRSDGTKATMREFVKEMLHYNPSFEITTSPKGETWYLKKKE